MLKNNSSHLKFGIPSGLFILLLAMLMPFTAKSMLYGGVLVDYTEIEYKSPNDSAPPNVTDQTVNANPFLVSAQLGYFLNDYIAFEGRYGKGFKRDSGIDIESVLTGLMKFNFPVTKQAAIYGLAGHSVLDMESNIHSATAEKGTSIGAGIHYAFNHDTAVTGELIQYLNNNDVTLTSFNLGLQYRF